MYEAGDNNLLKIARVLKSNGTDGEIILGFREFDAEDINLKEPVFIYYDGLPVPFFIKSFVPKGSSRAYVRLSDIICHEDAEEIIGRSVFAERESVSNDEDDLSMIIGWTLKDSEGIRIGKIIDFEDIPGNLCIVAETEKGQVMIPFHEDLILSLDEALREIEMSIPEGLL